MGRINYGQYLIDRKGITDRVTLDGMTLMNWKVFNLPLDKKFIYDLRSSGKIINKQGIFFKGNFSLLKLGDTYFDVSNYKKGIVWVNGHNLGRYWDIGPQKKLYCPALFLRQGLNEIIIFDLLETEPKPITGVGTAD
jgi:beta-galactosidase